jgi:hypothetical protein
MTETKYNPPDFTPHSSGLTTGDMRLFKVQVIMKHPDGFANVGTEWYDIAENISVALNNAAVTLCEQGVIFNNNRLIDMPIDDPDSREVSRKWVDDKGAEVHLNVRISGDVKTITEG